jgi:hypothetical protein
LINDEGLKIHVLLDDELPTRALAELRELDFSAVPGSLIQWKWVGHGWGWAWTYHKVDEMGRPRPVFTKQGLMISGSQGVWESGNWITTYIPIGERIYKIS